ncbi:MAG: FAD-binding oxidoreductase [Acidobacteria bacterium]|nr:FAD-binding oxidoreductase [Acidobacteriota bacterium]
MRPGTPADAVEGVVPRLVADPASAEDVAEALQSASRDRLSVFTRGAGTKLGWGPVPQPIDLLISMSRLNAVIAHRHGDLTATIQAGASLADVNEALARHRQWIPLDPPSADRATIGGLVATNDSGPRRHRYGTPRDLIIGVEFARADGRLAKGGGIVVKNVAGYDLPRLMTGSFGSLAVIVSATFKLYPQTSSSRTLVVELASPRDLGALTARLLASHLTPTAIEFQTPPLRLLVRFESIEAAVEQQTANTTKLIRDGGFSAKPATGVEEDQVWSQHGNAIIKNDGALIKVSTLPSELAGTLTSIDRLAGPHGYAAAGRAGLGVFLLHVGGDADAQKRVVTGLREALPQGRGSAVLVRASADLKAQVDVWGSIGDGLPLMRAVKLRFDPGGILNRGRGPGGI